MQVNVKVGVSRQRPLCFLFWCSALNSWKKFRLARLEWIIQKKIARISLLFFISVKVREENEDLFPWYTNFRKAHRWKSRFIIFLFSKNLYFIKTQAIQSLLACLHRNIHISTGTYIYYRQNYTGTGNDFFYLGCNYVLIDELYIANITSKKWIYLIYHTETLYLVFIKHEQSIYAYLQVT